VKEGINPYLLKEEDRLIITGEGYRKLAEMVTDPKGQVYAFNGTLPPVIVAAAMARLSRRMGDMREIILDEFMLDQGEDANFLLRRVVSEYGDDSVQQLVGVHFVVEGASNLLTKLLEWGRLASYLEQSTRYIYFDKLDEHGNFRYHIPQIEEHLLVFYKNTMNEIFTAYSYMVRALTQYLRTKNLEPADKRAAWIASTRAAACDAVRPVLPVATKSTVGIFASAQAADRLIMNLLSEPLPEARIKGEEILRELRKVIPIFLERTDVPSRGGSIIAHRAMTRASVRELARKYLDYSNIQQASCDVRLVSFWPESELDLVPEMLFEHAEPLSLREIEGQVQHFSTERRAEIFRAYVGERFNRRHRPGRAMEKAHFEWEFDGKDYGTFRDLQRHRIVDSWEWQRLSPRFGYEVPAIIKEAGLEADFRKCFDLSEALYNKISDRDEIQAQYATLLGHRMRYRAVINLREMFHIFELRTTPAGHPGYRAICNSMFNQLKPIYPLSAEGMKFVNQGESEELGRLATERAVQYKLDQLDSRK
jgi:thymidylate synthase ThyX